MKKVITILKISVLYLIIILNYCFGQERNDNLINISRLKNDSIDIGYNINKSLINYLVENVKYPQIAYENGIEGEVDAIIGIDSLGYLNYLFIESSSNQLLTKEVFSMFNDISGCNFINKSLFGKKIMIEFLFDFEWSENDSITKYFNEKIIIKKEVIPLASPNEEMKR